MKFWNTSDTFVLYSIKVPDVVALYIFTLVNLAFHQKVS